MDTKSTLNRIQKKKEISINKSWLQKYKSYIFEHFPESVLSMNQEGKFYIVDNRGARILRDEYCIPDSQTPLLAWKETHDMLWSKNIVDRNNRKFSDERIITGNFPGRRKSKIILK